MTTAAEHDFIGRVSALGDDATEQQMQNLVYWTIEHLPQSSWRWAASEAMHIDGFYTEISMRLGESRY